MSDRLDLLARTYDVVRAPVALLDASVLHRPTPCSEWSVQQVFDHLIGAIAMFAGAAGAAAPTEDTDATPLARFEAETQHSLAAWRSHEDPGATLSLPFGEFPADFVIAMNQLDSLIHGWDLAAALGVPMHLPAELAEAAHDTARISVPPSRGHAFGAEVTAPTDDPLARLVAFTGRDPAAWPGAIWIGGSLVTVKPTIGDGDTASAVEIWEREGSGPPQHVHAEHDEIWYVLEGRFTFLIGDTHVPATAGEVIVGPRGLPHTFRADSSDARLLDIHSPGGFEHFFVRAGRPASSLAPPPESSETNPAEMRAGIESFGARVVGPPLGAR